MSERMTYSVPGMHCGHCEHAVSAQLRALSGVEAVEVDLDSKVVTVRGPSLSDGALRAAIEAAGYRAA